MPSIVIVADDGTKFELPEESAGFSDLLKGAMEQWTRRHETATTPSSLHPQGDGLQPSDDEDDSTAEDVGRNWPADGDDASTCSQLSDFPEEDRYYQGANRLGLKQSVERLPSEGFGAANGLAADALFRQHVGRGRSADEDEVLASDVLPAEPAGLLGNSGASPTLTGAGEGGNGGSDTDSDRTASIAPDVDSRSHSNASSQGSVGFASGLGPMTPPRATLPGVVMSPVTVPGAARTADRHGDVVNLESASSDTDSDVSTADEDTLTPQPEEAAAPVAEPAEAATTDTLLGPRDDSVTPSSLSDEEDGSDDGEDAPARGSGASSTGTNRRSVSAAPAEPLEDSAREDSDVHIAVDSNASTPETLSLTSNTVAQEEQEVVEALKLGSPSSPSFAHEKVLLTVENTLGIPDSSAASAAASAASPLANGTGKAGGGSGSGGRALVRKAPPAGSHAGTDAPLRGAGRQDSGQATEVVLSPVEAGGGSERDAARSSARSHSTASSTGSINVDGAADERPRSATNLLSSSSPSAPSSQGRAGTTSASLSLRERLEDASLRNNSDDDSNEDEDAVVEPIRLVNDAAHSTHRDPRSGGPSSRSNSQPSSADRQDSAGRRSGGNGGSMTSMRKAYTVVVSAAEPLADDDDEDDDDDDHEVGHGLGDIHDDEDEHGPHAGTPHHYDVSDPVMAAALRSPVDPGMPSTNLGKAALLGTSPHNFHQRTPVMIGADEECVHLLSSEGHATIPTPKEGLDGAPMGTAAESTETSSPLDRTSSATSAKSASASASATAAPAAPTAAQTPATRDASSTEDEDEDEAREDDNDDAILYDGAVISKHKIVVDLLHSNTNSTPSQGVSPRAAGDGTTNTMSPAGLTPPSTSSQGTDGAALAASSSAAGTPRALPVDSVRLCVAYLQHFAALVKAFEAEYGEVASSGLCRSTSYTSHDSRGSASTAVTRASKEKETRPAELTTPLTRPLISCLTDWEADFLYTTVLQVPDAAKASARKAMEVCPEFDYRYPGMYLQREPTATALRDALRVPAPDKAGLIRLRELRQTAKQLRIEALVQLLTSWLADYMLRMCYCGADNFEAAHLIRVCFQANNDFNRREMEHLKIENEWPANEEE